MPIVSSIYQTDVHQQKSGGFWVTETHTDSDGRIYIIGPYLWNGSVDRDALLSQRASQLNEQLAEQEAALLLEE